MKKALALLALLSLALLVPVSTVSAQNDETVNIVTQSLVDNTGHSYGVRFYLSSTVGETTCVTPFIDQPNTYNVNGALGGRVYELAPNESNVYIGVFQQADSTQAWSARVGNQWTRGGC
jgi:hypothetical protein